MTDRLTPGQLRDLADLAEKMPMNVQGYTFLRDEAARREAEAKPQNGRGHIPLITCPGSTKSCMGYDRLDKGCLDGEPKPTHVCNFVDSDQVGVSICHGCGRKLLPKGLSVDALRSANISIGGCEVCTTPTGCKQEKHCDHFNMAFYSEREGPGSAAAPKGWCPETDTLCGAKACVDAGACVGTGGCMKADKPAPLCEHCGADRYQAHWPECPRKDKPAPAAAPDDQVDFLRARARHYMERERGTKMVLHDSATAATLNHAADRIEAQARQLELSIWHGKITTERADKAEARADRLAAAIRDIDRACNMAEVHRIAVDALTSEGGDRG